MLYSHLYFLDVYWFSNASKSNALSLHWCRQSTEGNPWYTKAIDCDTNFCSNIFKIFNTALILVKIIHYQFEIHAFFNIFFLHVL